jgi:hypothetical protein
VAGYSRCFTLSCEADEEWGVERPDPGPLRPAYILLETFGGEERILILLWSTYLRWR